LTSQGYVGEMETISYKHFLSRQRKILQLHNEELHNSSPSLIRMVKPRRMRWAEHVTRMGEKRNAYRIFVGKPEGRRPLGKPRRRWMDNIKMDLREIGWDGMD
jgi:hypothetical protein